MLEGEQGEMKYVTIIKKDGAVFQRVLDRGQHLCQNIYVAANKMGTITNDEELPEGDCTPVFHDVGVGG